MTIAKTLFKAEVNIEVLDMENENNMEHVIMRIHFDNSANFSLVSCSFSFGFAQIQGKNEDPFRDNVLRANIRITADIFFDIFPFIIVFNRGMRIRNIGLALLRYVSPLL